MALRRRLYLTLEPTEKGGILERIFEIFLIIIIILNIAAIVLDSVKEVHAEYQAFFEQFEAISIILFTCEYFLRIYSIVENPKYADPVKGRWKFMVTPIAIIDLLAIIPFYLSFLPLDLRFLRIFRLMAVFRLFKIARYLHALKIFRQVLADRKEQLVLSFLFIFFVLIIISFGMYYVESEVPDTKFTSIPATMWWGISTLTTVGYGDIVPTTTMGKILGGVIALAGVALLALPAGILSSGFYELLHHDIKPEPKKCPHCGKDIHDHD